jgi:hypothetical protein
VSELTVWTHARVGWSGVADWCARLVVSGRSAAASAVAGLLAAVVAVRGLAGLALISYGAWLAYPPAGFVTAGVLLLADRVLDERKEPTRG